MSDGYVPAPRSGFEPPADVEHDEQSKMDTAKQEANSLKETAADQVGDVVDTAKEEAANVSRETKSQVKDLYAQTQSELKEQAGVQQQRVAAGLRSLGDELSSMARNSESQGLASDIVRQVSDRAGGAASWLDARDPGSLLTELKSYARRKPGTFIAAAAIAGVVSGRLTRALAGVASDEKDMESAPASTTPPVAATAVRTGAPGLVGDDTPLYTERAAVLSEDTELPGEGIPR